MSEVLSQMYVGVYVKYPLFSSNFHVPWIFSADFRKILKYKISWKSVHWARSCFVRTDRRIDMTKLMVFFFFNSAYARQKASVTAFVRIPGDAW